LAFTKTLATSGHLSGGAVSWSGVLLIHHHGLTKCNSCHRWHHRQQRLAPLGLLELAPRTVCAELAERGDGQFICQSDAHFASWNYRSLHLDFPNSTLMDPCMILSRSFKAAICRCTTKPSPCRAGVYLIDQVRQDCCSQQAVCVSHRSGGAVLVCLCRSPCNESDQSGGVPNRQRLPGGMDHPHQVRDHHRQQEPGPVLPHQRGIRLPLHGAGDRLRADTLPPGMYPHGRSSSL
jgi:hypothetical protein